jgi:hypothetical protein
MVCEMTFKLQPYLLFRVIAHFLAHMHKNNQHYYSLGTHQSTTTTALNMQQIWFMVR